MKREKADAAAQELRSKQTMLQEQNKEVIATMEFLATAAQWLCFVIAKL